MAACARARRLACGRRGSKGAAQEARACRDFVMHDRDRMHELLRLAALGMDSFEGAAACART
jgi:hypothetical protein